MKKHLQFLVITCLAFLSASVFTQCTPSEAEIGKSRNITAEADPHPLDPLDSMELKLVKEVLEKNKMFSEDHVFSFIKLQEPPKAEVKAFEKGKSFRREALASVYNYDKNVLAEILIDLNGEKVLNVDTMKGMQPIGGFKKDSVVLSETMAANEEWVKALEKRGVHPDSVTYHGNYAADMGMAPKGHREEIVAAWFKKPFNRLPVAGLYAFVDLTDKKVLKIVDEGRGFSEPWKVNYFDEDSAVATIEEPKPIKIQQPEGVTYQVNGNQITWNNWRFRYGISNREGLIIYMAEYKDQGNWRSVLYRGSMPEMVVNYGSPDLLNASNNYFDVGEYRLGQSKARPMTPGVDAPENAQYFTTMLHDEKGKIIPFENAIAVYEEFDGPLWRHNDKGRPATNLAIKYFTTIGNYDYGFTWIFKQDGNIDVQTELNGIVHIRSVDRTNDLPGSTDEAYQGDYYGTLVEEHVEAVNHQHFFMYRLDLDVDGTTNSVAEMNTISVPGKDNPYKSTMVNQMTHFKTEKEAQRHINPASNRNWMVVNHEVNNKWGHHSSYMLMPSAGVRPLATEGSSLLNRAGFLKNHVWVTPLHEREIYPAGEYPMSNLKDPGLPTWAAQNREIENKDVVLWYLAGVTHIVRPEEWPIMTPHYVKFTLMPRGFFSASPVVKMPSKEKIELGSNEATPTSGPGYIYDDATKCFVPVSTVK